MKRSANFLSLLLLVACLACSVPAWAGHPKNQASPGASATPPKFNIPIPVGHTAEGVKLPYFDDRGKLQMYYDIKLATRTDQNHMALESANIQTYDEKQTPETNIILKSARLDLNTRILTSQVPVLIQRADMQVTGDKMNFNTQTRNGRVIGHVRVVIYNRQQDNGTAASSPTPAS